MATEPGFSTPDGYWSSLDDEELPWDLLDEEYDVDSDSEEAFWQTVDQEMGRGDEN